MGSSVAIGRGDRIQPARCSNKRKAAVAVTAIAISLLLAFGLCISLKAGPMSKLPSDIGFGMMGLAGFVAITWGCYEECMDPNR